MDSPAGQALQKQLQQIAGGQPVLQNVASASANNPSKFQQCIAEGDLEFVSYFGESVACKMLGFDFSYLFYVFVNDIIVNVVVFFELHFILGIVTETNIRANVHVPEVVKCQVSWIWW